MRLKIMFLSVAMAFSFVVFHACDCGGEKVGRIKCAENEDCKPGEVCKDGFCEKASCTTDADCCPGQICGTEGICEDSLEQCVEDADCKRGQKCEQLAGGAMLCALPSCEQTSDCQGVFQCFNGACIPQATKNRDLPCANKCVEGEVCAVRYNLCVAVPSSEPAGDAGGAGGSCSQSCGEGRILVFKDASTMLGAGCEPVECECATLLPIRPGDIGRMSEIGVKDGKVLASAYDTEYGDLMLASFDAAGNVDKIEYVDGLPESGDVVGDPAGPRSGIADPGPDVGQYTSIALDSSGNPRISYYDVDNKALKFAWFDGTDWHIHTVDQTEDGDIGMYSSLVLDDQDVAHVSYFMSGEKDEQGTVLTGVKYARAAGPAPQGEADWTSVLVDAVPLPLPPCGGECPGGEKCIEGENAAQTCVQPEDNAANCGGECGSDEVCYQGGCHNELKPPAVLELPQGLGLFTSIALKASVPYIGYYDGINENLKAAKALVPAPVAQTDFTASLVDGDDGQGNDTGDVGRFSSLAFDKDGNVGIAYMDASKYDLKFYFGADITGGTIEVVDTGETDSSALFVGADAALGFDAAGNAYIAYQDSSNNDLLFSQKLLGGSWSPAESLASDGAWGFYADIVIEGMKAYISSLRIGFKDGRKDNELRIFFRNL